jgi:hypothetical protein
VCISLFKVVRSKQLTQGLMEREKLKLLEQLDMPYGEKKNVLQMVHDHLHWSKDLGIYPVSLGTWGWCSYRHVVQAPKAIMLEDVETNSLGKLWK